MSLSPALQARLVIAIILLVLPGIAWANGLDYLVVIASRAVVFALAALALDFVLGRAGLVSLGHAAFLGIGGYMAAILAHHGIDNGLLHLGLALLVCLIVAFITGKLAIRLEGMYFIMVTLAFAQMLSYLFIGLESYGGDDGLPMASSSLPTFVATNSYAFYGLSVISLLTLALLLQIVDKSRFGRLLEGLHSNENRMKSLGVHTDNVKLVAWCISAVITGYAGFLMVNLGMFISPALMHWTLSALLIVMVVVGGAGSLWGPILGAILVVALEVWLPGAMNSLSKAAGFDLEPGHYWQIVFGPVLVLIAIKAPQGIWPWILRFFDEEKPSSR